jgi:hypothetical protein
MQGLKVLGGLLGWTRLTDEWLASVVTPLVDAEAARQSVVTAATRTRRFADGEEPAPIVPDAAGVIRFELQGITYAVATERVVASAGEADLLARAEGALAGAVEAAKQSAQGEEHAVGAALITPATGADAPDADELAAWAETLRLASLTHSLGYRVDGARGAFFLARSPQF